MATPIKIDPQVLDQLLAEGKSTTEIAKYFNCTPGAVSQAKRRLGLAVATDTASRVAPALVDQRKTAMDRLQLLADKCEKQLRWREENVQASNDAEHRAWQDQAIKFTAEARKLLTAWCDIRIRIYKAETVERALVIMLEEIGNESPECQKRIRDRFERCSIPFHVDD